MTFASIVIAAEILELVLKIVDNHAIELARHLESSDSHVIVWTSTLEISG